MSQAALDVRRRARAHKFVWEDCSPVYLLRVRGSRLVLMVEPIEHADLRAGDHVGVNLDKDLWMLVRVQSVGPKSVTIHTGERWGVSKDRRLFDAMLRVIGRPASHGRIVPLAADVGGVLQGWTLDRGGLAV